MKSRNHKCTVTGVCWIVEELEFLKKFFILYYYIYANFGTYWIKFNKHDIFLLGCNFKTFSRYIKSYQTCMYCEPTCFMLKNHIIDLSLISWYFPCSFPCPLHTMMVMEFQTWHITQLSDTQGQSSMFCIFDLHFSSELIQLENAAQKRFIHW